MLISVAIVPGSPALVAPLMGSAAHELDDLRHAVDSVVSGAVSDLVAASGDSLNAELAASRSTGAGPAQLVIVGPGPPREFNAAGPVSFGSFGRDFVVPALLEDSADDGGDKSEKGSKGNAVRSPNSDDRSGGAGANRELPTPLMVARHLASRDVATHPEHADLWASARWITTSGPDAISLGKALREGGEPVAMILIADGATCHGPKAPRAEDSRAPAYEDAVCEALASGQPAQLARSDAELGRELGATGPQVWPVLLAAADGDWTGELVWRGSQLGVGWAVAAWRQVSTRAGVASA